MKKVYLGAVFASLSLGAVAQQSTNAPAKLNKINLNGEVKTSGNSQLNYAAKALGVEIWSNDFDAPADWTVDNDGQAGGEFGWTIDATSDGWWAANGITSTSGGNYAELSNGDPTANPGTQVLDVNYTLTTANPIDINALSSGVNLVELSFEEFGARFNDLQEVQISTNGTDFTTVANNLDYSVLSASGGSAYDNPTTRVINISDAISGNPSTVWIRFSWTTNFPASATNPNVWVAYGWYIDDVKITTLADNNLTATEPFWGSAGLSYNQIPNTQVAPIGFSSRVVNNGSSDQTNAVLTVDITGNETTSLTSAASTITVGSNDSLFIDPEFTPNGTNGTYNFTWGVSQDATDDAPSDNSLTSGSFTVNDYVYARDLNSPDGTSNNQAEGFEVGNIFDVVSATSIYSIDVRIDATADAGTEIFAKLYSIDSEGNFVQEDQSDYYALTNSDLGGFINLDLLSGPGGFNLNAGETYLITVGSDGSGGQGDDLVVSTSGDTPPQTAFFYETSSLTWFYTTNIPMVRMNFDPSSNNVGIEENTLEGVAIFPNPTTGVITISNDNQTDNKIEVRDLAGKIIASTSAAIETTIDLTGNPSGVYMVKVYNENGATIEKVTLK